MNLLCTFQLFLELNYYLVEAHNAVDKAQQEKLIPEEAEDQVKIIL